MIKFKNLLVSILTFAISSQSFAQLTPVLEQAAEKNYVANGGFESAASGWKAYRNTAQVLPINGAGGTPVTTITASTSAPIAGKASGLITKPAVVAMGEGVSYAFKVDSAAKGRVLTLTGLYQIISGVYSGGTSTTDSDVEAYLYDVDAGQVIQPAGYKLDGGVAGLNYPINATFQTNINSSNYRLIFHIATATSAAFTLKLDSIKIGVQNRPQGPPVTDSLPYSPTNTNFGPLTSVAMNYRRVGDSVEIQGTFQMGTPTAAPASISIPSGLAALITNAQEAVVGRWSTNNGNGNTVKTGPLLIGNGGTSLFFSYDDQVSTISAQTHQNASSLGTSTNVIYINARVPIIGWSSNLTMSDSSSSRVVSFSSSTGVQSITAGVDIPFTTSTDNSGSWNGTQFRVPVPGDYSVSGNIGNSVTSTPSVFLNGTQYLGNYWSTAPAGQQSSGATLITDAKAGDLISLRTNVSGNLTNGVFFVNRLSGPSQIAASDPVYARYSQVASIAALPNSPFGFRDKISDSHSAYTPSTGIYRVPANGFYLINARLYTASSQYLTIVVNTSPVAQGDHSDSTTPATISDGIYLMAGDLVSINSIVSGTTTGGASLSNFSIVRTSP
jgi:hypothetical protein